jgi:hypothetical protein
VLPAAVVELHDEQRAGAVDRVRDAAQAGMAPRSNSGIAAGTTASAGCSRTASLTTTPAPPSATVR